MSITKASDGTKSFWPDDTDDTIFIKASFISVSLADIILKAKAKWGDDVSFDNLEIEGEHIQTSCLGYDKYDSSDYTNFLKITRNE